MEISAKMVIMSHLSDLQEFNLSKNEKATINFIKFLVLKYPDTNTEIDAKKEWNEYIEKYKKEEGGMLNKKVSFKELFTK